MTKPEPIRFVAQGLEGPTRLDRVLRDRFPQWGRQAVQRSISAGKVRLNARVVRLASWEVHRGDRVEISDPPVAKLPPPESLHNDWIVSEEADLIVINKPAGLLSQAARFGTTTSLLDLAQARFGEVVLFHRLDRDTSGLVLLTRPGAINKYLDEAFKSHTVQKEYLAVVATPNRLEPSGVIEARLGPDQRRRDQMQVVPRGGQRAVTRYAVEQQVADRQLVRLWPETGRTHQLRVHLAHLGAPIVGDRLYGTRPADEARLLLHAERISLPEAEGFSARSYYAPLPAGFWT